MWSAAACRRFLWREIAPGGPRAMEIRRKQACANESGTKVPHSKKDVPMFNPLTISRDARGIHHYGPVLGAPASVSPTSISSQSLGQVREIIWEIRD
jgi:hypothetical protein